MRSGITCIIVAVLTASAALAAPDRPGAAPPTKKYWVFFVDKPPAAGKSAAPAIVDARAVERRVRRGMLTGEFEDRPVSEPYLERLESMGLPVLRTSRWFNAASVRLAEEDLTRVVSLPFVREVRPVGPWRPPPAVTAAESAASKRLDLEFGPSQAQLAFVNAIRPLEEEVNGKGVRLGFLDTLFDFDHPALDHLQGDGRLLEVRSFTQPNEEEFGGVQRSFHGLNVSSIAVGYDPGQLIGPAYGAEVIAATTEFAPTETNQEEDNFVAGLEWLEANGADVVNVSLGYTTFDPGENSYSPEDMDGDTGLTTRAADRAAQLGVVMVVSAGNSGQDNWRIIGTPADGDSVIAVGGARPDSVRVGFSSVGPTADGRIKPDVSALGTSVYVARPGDGYASGSGTSFSSPMVAGVVCQMLQVDPSLRPMEVLQILRETASRADDPDNRLGWGIVNAHAAVEIARERAQALPSQVVVRAAYPLPFTRHLTMEIFVPEFDTDVSIGIFDVLGRRVGTAFEGTMSRGTNLVEFRPEKLSSGVYFYRLETEGRSSSGSLVYVR